MKSSYSKCLATWSFILSTVYSFPHSSSSHSYVTRRASVPPGWSRIGRADPLEIIDVSIGLSQNGFAELERHLFQVSDPFHSRYGKHLTSAEVERLAAPTQDSVDLVQSWLVTSNAVNESGIYMSTAKDWLYFNLPVETLESLLQTEYYIFQHDESGNTIVRTLDWSFPHHLSDYIEVIEPTSNFLIPRPQWFYGAPPPAWEEEGRLPTFEELVEEDLLDRDTLKVPNEDELPLQPTPKDACNRLAISPLCLRVMYGTMDYTPQVPNRNKIGITNFLGEVANRSDLRIFLNRYRPEAIGAADTFSVELVNGGDDTQSALTPQQLKKRKGYEGALDAQTVIGMAWPTNMITYNVGGQPPYRAFPWKTQNTNEPYLAWLQYMRTVDDADLPSVVSISYAEDEKSVPAEYARRVCHEFAILGARGVSILAASGDHGVGRSYQCQNTDGNALRFAPSFPATCPYVTAVGATRFLEPEMVAFDARTNYSSGGGFSDLFPQPAYQKEAVGEFLHSLGDQYQGLFNPKGRAIPDISAMGYHFSTYWNGSNHLQDGTSASTPTMASIVALLNDALIADGRPTLGFLNPWIYRQAHSGFRDVAIGSNFGCNVTGFEAIEGWDPATGFGTPWFPTLKDLALKLRFRSSKPWYYLSWS